MSIETYEPRDETEKFEEDMNYLINDTTDHSAVVLSGIS